MALDLGELRAIVTLDDSAFDKGIDGAKSKFAGLGTALRTSALAAGAVGAAVLMDAFTDALDFERSTDKLAAQLALTETESERVGAAAGALYADAYGGSLEEVNEALRGVISQTGDLGDMTDEQLNDMGAAALDFASAFDVDVSRAIQIAGQAVRNGLAPDFQSAMDLITAASQKTMPGLQEDVLDAADEYGIFFAQLGISGEEAFGMLASASAQGTYGIDKTGDALKEFTIRASDMSEGSVEAFEDIGLNAEDMAAKILAGGDTASDAFGQIIDGLLDMEDPVAQQTAALALFGTPLEDLSTAQIPEFLANLDSAESSLGDVGGAAADMGDTLNGNTSTALEGVSRKFKNGLMEAVEPLIPVLERVIEFLEPFAPILGPIAAGLAALAVVLGIAAAATFVFNAALWANPIVWIIAAIIALIAIIVLLVVYWDEVSAAIVAAWDWLREKAIEVWGAISDFFVMIGTAIADFFVNLWNTIADFFVGIWNSIKAFFIGIWNAIVNHARNQVNAILAVVGWFKDLPGKVSGWFQGVKDAAVNKMTALVDWVKGLPGRIKSALGDLGDLLKQAGRDLLNGLKDGIMSAWDSVKDTLADLTNKLPDWKGPPEKDKTILGPAGEMVIGGFVDGLERAIPTVQRALAGLTTDIGLQVDGAAAPSTLRVEATTSLADEDRQLLRELAEARNRVDVRLGANLTGVMRRENAMAVA